MINSTYQSGDASGGNEEDVLYQSDASFSAKLDNSQSHNANKQTINSHVINTIAEAASAIANTNDIINYNNNDSNESNNLNDNDNLSFNKPTVSNGIASSQSSTNVYKTNSNSKVSSRYNNKNYNVKSAANSNNKQTNSNASSATKLNGQSAAANQNTEQSQQSQQSQQPQRIDFYDKTSDWNVNDDDDIYSERQTDSTNDDYVYGIDDMNSGNHFTLCVLAMVLN